MTGLQLLFCQPLNFLAIGHDDLAFGFGIIKQQHISPLCHHILFIVRTNGGENVTIGCHLAQQQAHLHVVVVTGAVGIDYHGQLSLLGNHLFQILRTIHRKARTRGVAHHFRLERSGATTFHYLSLVCLGICQSHTCRDEHRC